jgi:ubiquitin-protein ligase E3 A
MVQPEELELIICGSEELDFSELQKASKYDDGYLKDSLTIKHMWEVLNEMSNEDKKKFIFFTTGCDRAPINGLGSLKITISKGGPDSDKLPSAHTCFNHLIMPDYQNKEKLRKLLTLAIQNSEGFGLM